MIRTNDATHPRGRVARPNVLIRAGLAAIVATIMLAPVAVADTCCANTAVRPEPAIATAGQTVRMIGIRCLNADNTPSSTGDPQRFWLWPGHRAADSAPDTTPGEGLPASLPAVETWPSFGSVQQDGALPGTATLTLPATLRPGTYQLWWWCDGFGPGGGIHYSTGPRLSVGPPDTAIAADPSPATPPSGVGSTLPLLVIGVVAFLASLAGTRRSSR